MQLPGMDPEAMAVSVTTPLERELAGVPHIAALTSETTEGSVRVRVAFDGNDAITAQQLVRAAMTRTMPLLPPGVSPPVSTVAGARAGRFLVRREAAETAVGRIEQLPGVGFVETCGGRHREKAIDLDRPRLAAVGLTVTDVVEALRSASPGQDLGKIVIATKNGVPLRVGDIAQVADQYEPLTCDLLVPSGNLAELVVDAQQGANVDEVRASIAKAVPDAIVMPRMPEPHVQLAPDVRLDKAVTAVHDALSQVPGTYVAEVRPGDVRILEGGQVAVAALRQLPVVLGGGEPTSLVHVSGADPHAVSAAARGIADRLEHAGVLVATHGLAIQTTLHITVDRGRSAALGVTASDIETTLAATGGIDVGSIDAQRIVVRAMIDPRPDGVAVLSVRGAGDTLVPLADLTTVENTTQPAEILHRGLLRAVDLEVHGDPASAIGAVPAGVRVEVDQYQ